MRVLPRLSIDGELRGVDHDDADGVALLLAACQRGLEGIVSKRADQPYSPGNRGIWLKSKRLNRAEFVIVGWSEPEGSRSLLGALLLGYYAPDGRLLYAGRVGTGMSEKTLRMLHGRLQPLATPKMALAVAPPRKTRFGGTLALSKVHWVKPELVAEITYLMRGEERPAAAHGLCRAARRQASAGSAARSCIAFNLIGDRFGTSRTHERYGSRQVQQPTATTGSGKDWLIADESGDRAETREGSLVADEVKEALGKDAEGFFEATWFAQGWKIGDRLLDQKW